MDTKTKLEISINEANNLKQITKMSGWKIIDKYIEGSKNKCYNTLKDTKNKSIEDIQAVRHLLDWIDNFRDLFRYKEISSAFDEQELKKLEKRK